MRIFYFLLLFMRAHNSKLTQFLQSAFFNPFLEPKPFGSDYRKDKEILHQCEFKAVTKNWRCIPFKSKIFNNLSEQFKITDRVQFNYKGLIRIIITKNSSEIWIQHLQIVTRRKFEKHLMLSITTKVSR